MARPYTRLRGEMRAHDIDQAYLARKLLLSPGCISDRINGHYPWTLDEMYNVMDLINWPYERMHELFPRKGIAAQTA